MRKRSAGEWRADELAGFAGERTKKRVGKQENAPELKLSNSHFALRPLRCRLSFSLVKNFFQFKFGILGVKNC